MKTLTKIAEKPKERIRKSRNTKKFQKEKGRVEIKVNSQIDFHNFEYRKCEKTSDKGIEDRWYVRKLAIDEAKYLHSLAKEYGIKNYEIYFKKLD